MEERQKKQLGDHLPLLVFIILYFIFQSFDWMEATKFIGAAFFGIITFFGMAAKFREEHKEEIDTPKLNFYIGLLTLLFIAIFLHGFLHWNRMLSYNLRFAFFFVLILFYFIALFGAMRKLSLYKQMLTTRKK
ncbi:MAG: hypothetical protein GF313_14020 [Caldithrix sp.]|nr:hypothetical protein [Caldithrix sp.]